ncbi:MAG: TlpA family protein disulfide reductase [Deltaproteobacteria bacterium]|nr:TlpA family protein disulfide reductase [Deltaproteobacteria bacterium]
MRSLACFLFITWVGGAASAGPVPAAAATEKGGGPLTIGRPAPAFKLRKLDGSLVRLDALAYSGKEKPWAKRRVVLLDFFRTDCGPCREGLPKLSSLHKKYVNRGLEVILVALLEPEEGRDKLTRYLADVKPEFTIVVDDAEHWSKKFLGDRVQIPALFLVDKTGNVAFKTTGLSDTATLTVAIDRALGSS